MSTTLRLKFGRLGPVKYLGHLDMMRYFQKAIQRAGVDIRYSEGFNPHQIMSFAYPLGVSMETEGDYLDIDVLSYVSCDDLKNDLNKVMKEGIYIEAVSVVPEGADAAMAAVAAADYRVVIKNDDLITNGDIKDFLAKDEIMVLKEGKKKTALCNIKEGILELKLLDYNVILMKLASGSVMNVKPIQVLAALSDFCGSSFAAESISRLEIYKNIEGKFYPLGDFSHS